MSSDFDYSPPVKVVDGLVAVPIDISQINAQIVFDLATQTATADVTITFTMGTTGNPVFDLRQNISEAYLNGASILTSRLQHHDFGGGPNAELIILENVLPAGSVNTLRLVYYLTQPQSPYSQPIGWDPPRLYFELWFTDLYPARYLEMWLPSNLIYDKFTLNLDIQLINTTIDHSIFANGIVNQYHQNHWQLIFPNRFTSLSPMLCIVATDRIERRRGTMRLPDSGTTLHLDIFKLTDSSADLATIQENIISYITSSINKVGPYIHGDKFTTFIWNSAGRSMEYEGAVTSSVPALEHEVFHSWFGRGVKPATQNDSWIDEGWTVYSTTAGRFSSIPFNMADPPVMLSSANAFSRITPTTSYSSGSRFFDGLAALMGVNTLQSYMSSFYHEYRGKLITTPQLEAYLILKSGFIQIADYFHRFVYGFEDSFTDDHHPDLFIRDALDDPGVDPYVGPVFWNSPDLWIRNLDDNGTASQDPKSGQDNWFYARVRNRGTATAKSFVVTFNFKVWAGTEFVYPHDFIPCINAVVGFDLAPGASTVVKARFPRAFVPEAGTHGCLLAAVYTPSSDLATPGKHVWEHNNLAQKNLTVIDLLPSASIIIPFHLGNLHLVEPRLYTVELRRPENWSNLSVSLVSKRPKLLSTLLMPTKPMSFFAAKHERSDRPMLRFLEPAKVEIVQRERTKPASVTENVVRMAIAKDSALELSVKKSDKTAYFKNASSEGTIVKPNAGLVVNRLGTEEVMFEPGLLTGFQIAIEAASQIRLDLELTAPPSSKPGDRLEMHLVQRDIISGQVVGGLTVQMNIVSK